MVDINKQDISQPSLNVALELMHFGFRSIAACLAQVIEIPSLFPKYIIRIDSDGKTKRTISLSIQDNRPDYRVRVVYCNGLAC